MFKMTIDLSEKGLKKNIYYCACWLIGEQENAIDDYGENSEEGQMAKSWLSDRKQMIKDICVEGCTTVYKEGFNGIPSDNKLFEAYLKYPPKTIRRWAEEAIDKLL